MRKANKVIAGVLSALMVLSATPVFAASTGSVASDKTVGEDAAQGKATSYQQVAPGDYSTDVYLTVDSGNILVGIPTTIILDGKANNEGKNIGKYSVSVEGDIPGDKMLVVEPASDTFKMSQKGKKDVDASVVQEKRTFSSEELSNGASADGEISAILDAGIWHGEFAFNISFVQKKVSTSEIAKTVMGYNANYGSNYTLILGSDNNANNNYACNYDTYVLPLSDFGTNVGDTLIFTNALPYTNFLYMGIILDENWEKIGTSNWVWKNANREITITEDMKYLTFAVINAYNENKPFNKADIPFEDFKLYKNSTDENNIIDYLNIWNKMIDYDNNLDFGYELWGHNMDWDYQDQQSKFTGQSLEKGLEFFDAYDLDLKSTKDGITICWYNATGYDNAVNYTYDELKQKYPNIMTFEEMLQYMKKYNKKCFCNLNNVSRNDLDLVNKYDMTNNVFWGGNENYNFTSETGNMYIFCQPSHLYSFPTYSSAKNHHNQFYINTDDYLYGGNYFTDKQINELIDNDINIGISFCMEHRINAFIDFCRTHDYSTLLKIKHIVLDDENALKCLKAACRYVYGM